jgi:hypothetical protein
MIVSSPQMRLLFIFFLLTELVQLGLSQPLTGSTLLLGNYTRLPNSLRVFNAQESGDTSKLPLDLSTIKRLINVYWDDSGLKDTYISGQIEKRGINFELNEPLIQELRKLGAGRKTCGLLESWLNESAYEIKLNPPSSDGLLGDDFDVCAMNYDRDLGEPEFYWSTSEKRILVDKRGNCAKLRTKDLGAESVPGPFTVTVSGVDRKGRSFAARAGVTVRKPLTVLIETPRADIVRGNEAKLTARLDANEHVAVDFIWKRNGKEFAHGPRVSMPTLDIDAVSKIVSVEITVTVMDSGARPLGRATRELFVHPSCALTLIPNVDDVFVVVGQFAQGTVSARSPRTLYVPAGKGIAVEARKPPLYRDKIFTLDLEAGSEKEIHVKLEPLARKLVKCAKLEYPPSVPDYILPVMITVIMKVDDSGNVISAVAKGHPSFVWVSERTAKTCKFEPVKRRDGPQITEETLTFSFPVKHP